jgi:ABC-type nitrate/sulfonate/bicarbonate transport system substrate-binding protein
MLSRAARRPGAGFLPPGAAPPPLKPYKVGFNAWIGSIAFFVAQQKGFFKDEGSTCNQELQLAG